MKNRPWHLFCLLFWLIPALACSGGSAAVATATPPSAVKATATTVATATTGSTSATTGHFGPITFSVGVLNDETPVDPLDKYPDGVTLVYAAFSYSGMQDGETWRTEWKHDGLVQTDLIHEKQWKGGANGTWWVNVSNPKGIRTGEWELDVYLGDTLQQSGKIIIEPNPAGQPDFGPITFSPDKDSKDQPLNALSLDNPILPKGTPLVYAFFDGIAVPKGTTWTSHWYLNGQSVSDPKDHTWDFGPNDNDWISFGTTDNSPMKSGTYELKLTIGSNLVNVATYIMP